ncbi:MAG: helix-turn-helix transcriptional regulator [Dehalococcoidia bacterium]|nr:helix-turn-helix transcriptional regulator [Dehalococcoidia bacterium]
MNLGDRIRQLREQFSLTQGQLAGSSSVSQGYLSQLENGEVKNPSAAVLLRVAQAMHVDPDELFDAAGYPTVRALRQIYEGYESTIDSNLLRYLAQLPREKQRRLLFLLEGIEKVLVDADEGGEAPAWRHHGHAGEGRAAAAHSGRQAQLTKLPG